MTLRDQPARERGFPHADSFLGRLRAFSLLGILYALPIWTAERFFLDDLGRALHGSTDWSHGGRPLADFIYHLLFFGRPVADISPLPQLVGLVLLATAAALLSLQLFPKGAGYRPLPAILVAFPIIGSPFFLENLAYKFDALTMSAAMLTAVIAALPHRRPWIDHAVGSLLVVATLSLYQPAINAFVGFTILLWFSALESGRNHKPFRLPLANGVKCVTGSALYFTLIAPATLTGEYTAERSRIIEASGTGFATMQDTMTQSLELITEYIASLPGAITLVIAAVCIGYPIRLAHLVWKRSPSGQAALILLLIPAALLLLALTPFGILLLLENPVIFPRTFVGFCAVLVFAMYAFQRLTHRFPVLQWLLLVPVAMMWVHAHIFAGALKAQERFDRHFVSGLTHQLQAIGLTAANPLIIDGQQPRAPTVLTAIAAWPPVDRLVPPYLHYQWIWGYMTLRHYGLEFLNPPDDWATRLASSCAWPTLVYHPHYTIRSDGDTFAVSLAHTSCP